jgi:hypothetical protein
MFKWQLCLPRSYIISVWFYLVVIICKMFNFIFLCLLVLTYYKLWPLSSSIIKKLFIIFITTITEELETVYVYKHKNFITK